MALVPLGIGHSIVDTREAHHAAVLEVIKEFGLELEVIQRRSHVLMTRDRGDSCHRFPIGMSKRATDPIDSLLVSVAMVPLMRCCAAPTHALVRKDESRKFEASLRYGKTATYSWRHVRNFLS